MKQVTISAALHARASVRSRVTRRLSQCEASRTRPPRAAGADSVVRAPRGGVPELVVESASPAQRLRRPHIPARVCHAIPCPVPVCRAALEGPVGARALYAKLAQACGLALSWGLVLAVDLSCCSRTLRVSTGLSLRSLPGEGCIAGTSGCVLGFGERSGTAWGVNQGEAQQPSGANSPQHMFSSHAWLCTCRPPLIRAFSALKGSGNVCTGHLRSQH